MKLAALTAAAILATGSGAFAGPAMSINADDLTLDQAACMTLAAKVVRGADLSKNFQVATQTVYGEKGEYTGAIRCIAARRVVVFVVAGPSDKESAPLSRKLRDDFDAGQKPKR